MNILYIKGGQAVEEAMRLFPRKGILIDGGPDQYLLAVLHHLDQGRLRLVTFGEHDAHWGDDKLGAVEYPLRPLAVNRLRRRLAFCTSAFDFFIDTLRFRPQRVLCGLDGPIALVALLAARLCGAEFVFFGHNAIESVSRAYRFSNAIMCRLANKVVVHGPFVRDEALKLGTAPGKLIEYNNGISATQRQLISGFPEKRNQGIENEVKTLLYVGRIEEDKGALDLLEAFLRLPDRHRLQLHYIGSGGAVTALQAKITSLGLNDHVRLLGSLEHDEVFSHMHHATAVVTPSQSRFPEGRCKTAMEAFYVGTPVVAPDYGPFPYLVEDGINGLLYPANDVDALAAALQRIVNKPDLAAQLEQGARHSGQRLMRPELPFHQALRLIFRADAPV
ncbi:MAG TPA: glycosyltransferase family 4 protein [Rhodocyclaceae bacterium]|nr:glycosyltransferase family 4 protein [Rhodocyclaceae bacterium]